MKCIFLLIFLLTHSITVSAADRPNILFIHMEDMGVQIPAYGDHTVATPNLDKLAAEGVVFERAHVTAATCAASRGALFSGLYPHQNGIMGFVQQHGFHYRDGIPTFVKDLKAAGYRTGLTYKDGVESSHHKSKPVPFDFHPKYTENWLTGLIGKKAPKSKDNPPLVSYSIDNFKYFLENLKEGQPFYFQAQTPDTHHVWDRPHFIRDGDPGWPYPEVDTSRIKATPGWGDALVPTGPLLKTVAEYYRAIQRVDWYVGRILALLEEHGHADNTLVIFSADHGPSHLLRGKKTPGEFGLQVPFIVRWPAQIRKPGSRSKALVSFVDLYPTFVDAAGLDIPGHLPGHSILPALKGQASPRKHLYSAFVAHTTGMHQYWPSRTVTDGRWKLIHHVLGDGKRSRYTEKNKAVYSLNKQIESMPADALARQLRHRCEVPPAFELYDLENDPYEHHDLFGTPEHAEIEQELKMRLKKWRQQVSDPFLDETFVRRFSDVYRKNYNLWKSLGGDKMKDKDALDFEEFIPDWDPTPYLGKKDQ
jgi:N-sulfoglucosamine sulfohydrolase